MLLSKANADIQTAKLLLSPVGNPTNFVRVARAFAFLCGQSASDDLLAFGRIPV